MPARIRKVARSHYDGTLDNKIHLRGVAILGLRAVLQLEERPLVSARVHGRIEAQRTDDIHDARDECEDAEQRVVDAGDLQVIQTQ